VCHRPAKDITLFSLFLDMKRNSGARLETNIKVYLIPKDKYKEVDGKPVLDDKYLVYEDKKKK